MTLGIEVDSSINIPAEKVKDANQQRKLDAATKGFAVSQERAPQDRGTLQQSGFQPEVRSDGTIVYGYTAPYAAPMEFGTGPFYPPVEPLVEWAERIGKDPGFGYYVARQKIPEEGIDAQPFLRPSADAVRGFLNTRGLSDYL
jgi:hypothetical protein